MNDGVVNDGVIRPGSMAPRRKGCPFTKDHTGQERKCGNWCGLWIPHADDPATGFCSIMSVAVSLAVLASPTK